MDYFRILNLNQEPFSNSPEPEFFFQSMKHLGCLQKIELAVRLRRGLNVVLGDVGTGKTTLCRQLILKFSESEDDSNDIQTHLLMDPGFTSPIEFLSAIAQSFGISLASNFESEWQFKENIKKYLLQKGVDEAKTVVLIIDEGQKLPDFCIEILREFLNYETNEHKLLQIIIFAQREFEQTLTKYKNFADRVNLYYYLKPLNLRETFGMVRYRIAKAGDTVKTPSLFTYSGLLALYFATKGYPRKIVTLCHQVMLALIIQNRSKAGWFEVRSCAGRVTTINKKGFGRSIAATIVLFAIIIISALFFIDTSDIRPVKKMLEIAQYNKIIPNKEISSKSEYKKIIPAKEISSKSEYDEIIPVVQAEAITTDLIENTPAKEMTAPIPPQIPVPEKTMPDLLGKLTIKDGEIVWRIMKDIYGEFSNEVFQKVVLANPHIKNLDKIMTGEVLNLPTIPAESNPLPSGKYLVRVVTNQDIRAIYELYNGYKELLPSLEFLPYWNKSEGMVFAIFLKNGYENMESAKTIIDKLPHTIASNAKIFEKLDDGTLFFLQRYQERANK
ncbi:MAG: AAA family ATPase [Proteobacteria bacterium]|nr:AAA family ATPase [Pseudomonadota bacterium]